MGREWVSATPSAVVLQEEQRPPRFLGSPLHACPGLPPRWTLHSQTDPRLWWRGLPHSRRCRRPQSHDFGADNRGLHARCLHFTPRVTPVGARLASGCSVSSAGRVGKTRNGLQYKVSPVVPPCPSFAWRTASACPLRGSGLGSRVSGLGSPTGLCNPPPRRPTRTRTLHPRRSTPGPHPLAHDEAA